MINLKLIKDAGFAGKATPPDAGRPVNKGKGKGGSVGGGKKGSSPLNVTGGIQALYYPPTGSSGSYKFKTSDVQIYPSSVTPQQQSGFSIDSEGYLYKASGAYEYALYSLGDEFPAHTTGTRTYTMYGSYVGTSAPTTNTGVWIVFNYTDANNYWNVQLYWSGVAWSSVLQSVIGGSAVNRGAHNGSATTPYPVQWWLTVMDHGDLVRGSMGYYEEDDVIDDWCQITSYTTTSRPGVGKTNFAFGLLNNPGSNMRIKGISILDMENA